MAKTPTPTPNEIEKILRDQLIDSCASLSAIFALATGEAMSAVHVVEEITEEVQQHYLAAKGKPLPDGSFELLPGMKSLCTVLLARISAHEAKQFLKKQEKDT